MAPGGGHGPSRPSGFCGARAHRQAVRLAGVVLLWALATFLVHAHFQKRKLTEELRPPEALALVYPTSGSVALGQAAEQEVFGAQPPDPDPTVAQTVQSLEAGTVAAEPGDMRSTCPQVAPEVICFDLESTADFDHARVERLKAHLAQRQRRERLTHAERGAEYDQTRVLRFPRPSLDDAPRARGGALLRGAPRDGDGDGDGNGDGDGGAALVEAAAAQVYAAAAEWGVRRNGWDFRLNRLSRQIEAMQMVSYEQGGWYSEHQDTVWWGGEAMGVQATQQRVVTMLLQLSDGGTEYEGGLLQLKAKDGTWVDAPSRAGTVVIFPAHLTRHRVTRVERGTRDVLVWWLWGTFA